MPHFTAAVVLAAFSLSGSLISDYFSAAVHYLKRLRHLQWFYLVFVAQELVFHLLLSFSQPHSFSTLPLFSLFDDSLNTTKSALSVHLSAVLFVYCSSNLVFAFFFNVRPSASPFVSPVPLAPSFSFSLSLSHRPLLPLTDSVINWFSARCVSSVSL